MHPSVASLPLEEKGFLLAALLNRLTGPSLREQLGGAAGRRCGDALEALALEPKPVRAAALASLITLVRAPVPAGVERIHPDWLRERLAREPAPVVRAVLEGLPPEVRRIGDELLAARHQTAAPAAAVLPEGTAALRRVVFAGFVPLAGPGAPAGPVARALVAVMPEGLAEALDQRGAETLGVALRRAPGAVVARAAAALDADLGNLVVATAARDGAPEERDRARQIVAAAAAGTPAERVRDIGLRAAAAALREEGPAATAAVAQRMTPALGRRLLEVAGLSGLL